MELTEKKGYLTIAMTVHKEGKILLRSTIGIQEWFNAIMVQKGLGMTIILIRYIIEVLLLLIKEKSS